MGEEESGWQERIAELEEYRDSKAVERQRLDDTLGVRDRELEVRTNSSCPCFCCGRPRLRPKSTRLVRSRLHSYTCE